MKQKHETKQFLNLAGEFLVAGELNRRGILSSITYGASKKADIFIHDEALEKIVKVEVKATNQKEWLVGEKALDLANVKSNWFWVFVHLPIGNLDLEPIDEGSNMSRGETCPRYYILTSKEVNVAATSASEIYKSKYRGKHGIEFSGAGVHKIKLADLETHEDSWFKIYKYFIQKIVQ